MFLQQLINGLMLGATYSLVAIGYTLIFGVLNLLHFAHGEVFMLGAFLGLQMVLLTNCHIAVALLSAMVGAAFLGLIIERISFRPIDKQYHLAPLISTIGVSVILQELGVTIFGGDQLSFPETIRIVVYELGPLQVTSLHLVILGAALTLMIFIHLVIHRTKVGIAMRVTAENATTASLMGINTNGITSVTFLISSALAGAAGVLVGLVYHAISPFMGTTMILKGFTIMLLGGLGNVMGAMVGGILLGLVEVFSVAYLASSYKDAFAFGIMILILIAKPTGLFGSRLHQE
jgi:branched-chain amino acid transport system permease protein